MRPTLISSWIGAGLLCCAVAVGAAGQELNYEQHVVESKTGTWMGFALADLNRDGLVDVVVQNGGHGGPLLWYETGSEGTQWMRHVIASEGPGGDHFTTGDLEVADIDDDGDVDVLGFEHPGEWGTDSTGVRGSTKPTNVYWYENDGIGRNWRAHRIGAMPDFVKDVEIEDYDGDGRLDLAMITYNDEHVFAVFRQAPDGSFERVQYFAIPGLHEGMDSCDLDGDGDLDVAPNGYWVENPGGDLTDVWTVRRIDARWHTQGGDWRQNATKVVCRDLDGDGRGEVFVSHSEQSGYPIVWYGADDPANPDSWEMHVIGRGLNAVHTLEVADFDDDGDLDVLAGENGDSRTDEIRDDGGKQVRIFLNESGSWKPVIFSEDGLYNGRVADVDGDGRLDIAGPTGHEGDPYSVYLAQ